MTKTFHFMAGLPRSGSTLLAALLNQHPEIYASPQSALLDLLYTTQEMAQSSESYKANLNINSYDFVAKSIPEAFYSYIKKPVVIDKNRTWGTPYNITNLMPLVNPKGKIVITVRPILEILASFAKIVEQNRLLNPNFSVAPFGFWSSTYRNIKDAEIDFLMMPNNKIDQDIYSLSNLLQNYKDKIHVVFYDDLIDQTQITLNNIYNFLELEPITNNLNQIKAVDFHNDLDGYGIVGLHDVKPKIAKNKTNPSDYLSDYIIAKYKNGLDFLDLRCSNR